MPPVLSKMLSAKGSEEARSLLAEFIVQFTSRRSFWFVINSLGEHVYDLIHHFGLERLDYMALLLAAGLIKIDKNNKVTYEGAQWELFVESYFDASEVEYTGMRTTIPNEGRVQCHLLRIGDKAQTSYLYEDYPRPRINNFSNQLKFDDRAMQPPKPAGLRAEQRRLFRLGRNLIMKQIIHSIDTTNYFEDYLTKIDTTDMKSATATTTKEVATSAAATTKASAAITKTTTEAAESANSSCSQPSPAKKQRRDDAATTSKQMTPSYSNLSRDVDELDKALKERSDAEYVDKCVDKVFADIVALKENCSVIGYKDKRLHDVSLVRVPKATTNNSFAQSDGWVDKAISINSPDDKYNGIRRLVQKLVKIDEDAVLEALDNVGMKVATPMNETKLAAMFKHGNLNFTQQQKILQHLRDHYGKKAFASLQKIAMFCEDHTYVNTGEIEYRYEEDGVLETIDYYEKNIASEVQKQLGFAIASLEKSVTLIKRIDVVIENNTNPNTTNNNADTDAVAKQILNRRAELAKFLAEEKTLQTQRDAITKRLNQARKYASKLKEKLAEWRSQRKRKDGIESKMDKVLKQVGVEIQRYHGGSLTGKDIIKVVGNATFIFDEFSKIFKEHRREDGWDDDKIENLCASYKLTFLLWDGAFSHARTVNPTEHDFSMYSRYVKAAVHCHVKIGCSVTPKVHLMLKHTLYQMKNIEGGLGDKMEDWVELMHQTGQRMRVRFRTVKCRQVRASAMAKVVQMNSIPELDEQIEGVTQRASNPRKTNKVEDDHMNRVERRLSALRAFESGEAAISKE